MPLLILLLLLIASVPSCSPAPTPRPTTRPSSTSIPSTNRGSPPGGLPFIRSVTGRVRPRNSVANTDFYSGFRPSLSGSTLQSGIMSTHQSVSGSTFRNFSNGRNCASSRFGTVDSGSGVSIGKIKRGPESFLAAGSSACCMTDTPARLHRQG